MRAVFIAAHPDDEMTSIGALLTLDIELAYILVCDPQSPRLMQEGESYKTLSGELTQVLDELSVGDNRRHYWNISPRYFIDNRNYIRDLIYQYNRNDAPDLVFIPNSTNIHQDHVVVREEAMRVFKCSIYGYEMPWGDNRFSKDLYVPIDEVIMKRKMHIIDLYRSQSHYRYCQPKYHRALNMVHGVNCDSMYAECFEVNKLIL